MNRFCLPLIVLALCISPRASAQVVAGPPDYLFVVNTSNAFEPYRQTVRNFVYDMLDTGLQGRMKDGDTYTVWTFNESVDTTTFPVLEWSGGMATELGGRAFEFLRIRSFEGRNNWRDAQIALFSAIKGVPDLTVILISDGFHPMKGTPYDEKINEVYAQFSLKFQEEGRPFITTIVGREGKVVGAAVNTVGEELVDPTPAPKEPEPAPVVEEPVVESPVPEPLAVETPVAPVETPTLLITEEEPAEEPAEVPAVVEEEPESEPVVDAIEPSTEESTEPEQVAVEQEIAQDAPADVEEVPEVVDVIKPAMPAETPVVESVVEIEEPDEAVQAAAVAEVPKADVPAKPEPSEILVAAAPDPVVIDETTSAAPVVETSQPSEPALETTPDPGVPEESQSGNLATIYYGLAGACALGAVCLLGYWIGRSKARRDSSFITQSIDQRR